MSFAGHLDRSLQHQRTESHILDHYEMSKERAKLIFEVFDRTCVCAERPRYPLFYLGYENRSYQETIYP